MYHIYRDFLNQRLHQPITSFSFCLAREPHYDRPAAPCTPPCAQLFTLDPHVHIYASTKQALHGPGMGLLRIFPDLLQITVEPRESPSTTWQFQEGFCSLYVFIFLFLSPHTRSRCQKPRSTRRARMYATCRRAICKYYHLINQADGWCDASWNSGG